MPVEKRLEVIMGKCIESEILVVGQFEIFHPLPCLTAYAIL
jgi:hypothetical protein